MQSDKSNSGTLWEQLGELEEDDRNVPGPSAAYGTARAPETPSGQMSSTHSPERIGTSHSTPTSRTSGAIAVVNETNYLEVYTPSVDTPGIFWVLISTSLRPPGNTVSSTLVAAASAASSSS